MNKKKNKMKLLAGKNPVARPKVIPQQCKDVDGKNNYRATSTSAVSIETRRSRTPRTGKGEKMDTSSGSGVAQN